jgi:arylsulfatase A-like enzyme
MKNAVLITLDATRKDVLGCYGNTKNLSPFIDSMQDKSIIFTNGQAIGPYTQASFPGILTSSYYLEYGRPSGLAPQRTLISEILQKYGITTVAFHSNPFLTEDLGWNRGWDVFYDSMDEEEEPELAYVRGNVINAKVEDWLTSHVGSGEYNRFFLWLHFMDVHEPYMPSKQYIEMVEPSLGVPPHEMYSLFETLLKRDASDPGKVELLKRLYDIQVREVDTYVQEFFNHLQRLGVMEDTVIIITSDHGDEFNEHGGLSHDDKMYSELIDIPLIIYDPTRTKGDICDKLVSNIDIPPTIIYLFGLDPLPDFEGTSLLPIVDYPNKGVIGEAVYQRSPHRGDPERGSDMNRDIYYFREDDMKVIYRANMDYWEMYDLKEDPRESNNIIAKSPYAEALKGRLMPRVRRWQKK